MFNIGDKIVYGSEGVFTVSEYTSSPIDKNDARVFYILVPLYGPQNNKIVAPGEGGAVSVRAVISRDDALALIERIPDIEEVTVLQERGRRDAYREVLNGGRGEDYVSIIKTVRRRRKEFMAQKRRLSETDTDFESRAKNCLFSEIATALGVTKGEAEAIVDEKLIIE